MKPDILSSNIKETPKSILDGAQELTDYYFGKDTAFIPNLKKNNAQLFYSLKDDELQGFAAAFIAYEGNEYLSKALDRTEETKELKEKLFACGEVGVLYIIAFKQEFQNQNNAIEFTKECMNYFEQNNVKQSLALAWDYNGKIPAHNSLIAAGYNQVADLTRCNAGTGSDGCPHKTPEISCKCKSQVYYYTIGQLQK